MHANDFDWHLVDVGRQRHRNKVYKLRAHKHTRIHAYKQ